MDNADIVAKLAPLLAELEITCSYRAELPAIEEPLSAMETFMNNNHEPKPGLVSIPSMSDALLAHFYQLVADYYQAAPWHRLNDLHPLEIRYPPSGSPRYAVVMGSGGEMFGLAVYDSLDELRKIYEEELPAQEAALVPCVGLYFDEAMAMSFDDLDAITEHDWPIAAENAYPVFCRLLNGHELLLPSFSDVTWFEGTLAALLRYVRDYPAPPEHVVEPIELTIPVEVISGNAKVSLKIPAFDAWTLAHEE